MLILKVSSDYKTDMLMSNALIFFIADIYKPTSQCSKQSSKLRTTSKQSSSILSLVKALLGLFHQEAVNWESRLWNCSCCVCKT